MEHNDKVIPLSLSGYGPFLRPVDFQHDRPRLLTPSHLVELSTSSQRQSLRLSLGGQRECEASDDGNMSHLCSYKVQIQLTDVVDTSGIERLIG